MTSLAFDTHKFVKDLAKAGMDTALAEVLANHYASLLDDRLATKVDLTHLGEDLRKDMATMEESLRKDMATMEESLRKDMAIMEESLRKDMAVMEERLRKDMAAMEERLSSKINITVMAAQLTGVVATCAIMGFMLTVMT
ncbi:hypothetical protein AB8880_06945 [Alphaproteobacteria bacterium LSUCC0684]